MEAEHAFWIPVLRDHLGFFARRLSVTNSDDETAATRIYELLLIADDLETRTDTLSLEEARQFAQAVKELKLDLLAGMIEGDPKPHLSLPATFINHTLTEVNEYLLILYTLSEKGTLPPESRLHQHRLWLMDAAGHLDTIIQNLDPTEKEWIKVAKKLCKRFHALHQKAVEYSGYLNINLTKENIMEFLVPKDFLMDASFPLAQRLTVESEKQTLFYLAFLAELDSLLAEDQLNTLIDANFIDHMRREQSYYLSKLGVSNGVDPTCRRVPAEPMVKQ